MNPHPAWELRAHFEHGDYPLAIRRLLDASMDTGDPALIKESIQLSRQLNEQVKEAGSVLPEALGSRIQSFLGQLSKQPSAAPSPTFLLQVDGLSKQYRNSRFSLKPVSFHLSTGDVMGIVGENGNGKTTLLRSVSGQLAIDSGSIRYPALNRPDNYAIRSYTAFIPQRIPRWWGQLKDNLHFAASIAGLHGEDNHLMVEFLLERLGLAPYAHLDWNSISSGYRTRFEIARVLLQRPRLLVLDEPLANLDINAQQTILTDLRFIGSAVHHPMGIILSSQQLHEVEKVADRVMFIKEGNCVIQSAKQGQQLDSWAVEFETDTSREEVIRVTGETDLRFNGGLYTLVSTSQEPQAILSKLIGGGVRLAYFRDISYSTKRLF